jgi:hypothetical protein
MIQRNKENWRLSQKGIEKLGYRNYISVVRKRIANKDFKPVAYSFLDYFVAYVVLGWNPAKLDRMQQRIEKQNEKYLNAMRLW